jgi:hypothetical protein
MKQIIVILIIFCCSAMLVAENPVALALKVQGKVDWNHLGKTTSLAQGKSLFNNDNLVSFKDAYASVKFADGSSLLKVFPNSSVRINTSKEGNQMTKKTYLQSGTVYSKVAQKTGLYEVESPKTIASVKGTEFLMSVSNAGDTELYTFKGKVKLTNRSDGSTAEIGPNEKGVSTGTGSIAVSKFSESDLPSEIREGLKDTNSNSNGLELEMKNSDGETHKVRVEFE